MKIVDVPETVQVKSSVGGGPAVGISFKDFLTTHMDTYSAIKLPSQIRQAAKIIGVIEAGNGTMAFEDADYEIVKGAISEGKYLPGASRQMLSYYDAIDKAQEVKK